MSGPEASTRQRGDSSISGRSRLPARIRPRSILVAGIAVAVLGCGQPPGSSSSPVPVATGAPTSSGSASPVQGPATFPPQETPVEAGLYRWDGFTPAIELEVGAGWVLGHRHPEYFDLFRGGQFPSIGFGRFPEVYGADAELVPTSDAETVIAALQANAALEADELGPTTLDGLTGRTVDLRSTVAQAPAFEGSGGTFRLDPGFVTRYRVLDLPAGGVLLVIVLAEDSSLDAGVELAAPVIDSLRVLDGGG